jgi:hypothetical protein
MSDDRVQLADLIGSFRSPEFPQGFATLERGRCSAPCSCGGYMDLVDPNEHEVEHLGCGRDRNGRRCCAGGLVCRICQKRVAASIEAPEME